MAISSHSYPSSLSLFLPKKPLSPFKLLFLSPASVSIHTSHQTYNSYNTSAKYLIESDNPSTPKKPSPRPSSFSSPWLQKWPAPNTPPNQSNSKIYAQNAPAGSRYIDTDKGHSAIERIVHRLRNLELGSDDDDDEEVSTDRANNSDGFPWDGEEKLSDLLQRSWVRPDTIVVSSGDDSLLPWEREDDMSRDEDGGAVRKKRVKAPTLAELTIEDAELRRLRREGMVLRERINIAKAGVTQDILQKIHQTWRKSELVRLKFHESLAHDMKMAHEIVERRTGGLVIWRSGSVMVVYRGSNYEWPASIPPSSTTQSTSQDILQDGDALYVPDVFPAKDSASESGNQSISSTVETANPSVGCPLPAERMTVEEAEYNSLLDGLGPRFVDWWGTGVLPIDADLLPQHIPGYKTPFRLLPTGMRSRLTNAEMTSLRKLAKSLPCHFALGRNRNHHGLAAAIVKLWEKSIIVKIAVKRGVQNTNNKLMAEEIKNLTGGILLLRNKYYIVIYRGKDFLPTSVAAALAERQELTKNIQDVEEKARLRTFCPVSVTTVVPECYTLIEDNIDVEEEGLHGGAIEGHALAGTLAEFHEAQARWGREISAEEHEKIKEEASRAKSLKVVNRIEHKLAVAQVKKLRAETLLAKIEASMVPVGPSDDQETITDEERFMFRRVGLRMKAYLPLGIRGVFDGVIENMHLHWKHRELVKLISKQKTLAFVEETARLLEYESGGILVAIERVPKGYALIYYRGKNYQRPISIRPRNLLTKAKALKRSVAMQRHEALSQHISELESTIEQMRSELLSKFSMSSGEYPQGYSKDVEDGNARSLDKETEFGSVSKFIQSEDEDSFRDSDEEDVGVDEDADCGENKSSEI